MLGEELTASLDSWTPSVDSYSYQWLRNGSPITGAAGGKYQLTVADVNQRISFRVTGAKAGYRSETVTSSTATAQAEFLTFSSTPAPTISGTPEVGETLTASVPAWVPARFVESVRWLRDGQPIEYAVMSTSSQGLTRVMRFQSA